MTYAKDTSVSVEKSRAELDKLLSAHGATQRLIGVDDVAGIAFAGFSLGGRQVRVRVPLTTVRDIEKGPKPRTWFSKREDQRRAWVRDELEQRHRTRWRALLLLTKAKLEAIQMGVSTVEREFLADVSLPDGRSVHEALAADLERAYLTGAPPRLLGTGA